jgi:hypothetical protein
VDDCRELRQLLSPLAQQGPEHLVVLPAQHSSSSGGSTTGQQQASDRVAGIPLPVVSANLSSCSVAVLLMMTV